MSQPVGRDYLPTGAAVVDATGERIGTIRAVYPHYVAVAEHGNPPTGFRVPFRAIRAVADDTVRLSVPAAVLDRMTPEELAAHGLPHHGGEAPRGTGGPTPTQAAAGETLGGAQIGDGEPGIPPPDEEQNLRNALFRSATGTGGEFGGAPDAPPNRES